MGGVYRRAGRRNLGELFPRAARARAGKKKAPRLSQRSELRLDLFEPATHAGVPLLIRQVAPVAVGPGLSLARALHRGQKNCQPYLQILNDCALKT